MLYAILCYHDEDTVGSWSKEHDAAVMKKLAVVQDKLAKQGRLGPVARLLPTTAATTLRKDDPPLVAQITTWFGRALREKLEVALARAGIAVDPLFAAPAAANRKSFSYCPRCRDQFVAGCTTCPHGIVLETLLSPTLKQEVGGKRGSA